MSNKLRKIAASLMAVATLSMGAVGMSASAYNDVFTYCSFEWTTTSAQTTNITNTNRRVAANITVYRDGTGEYVTTNGADNSGRYGALAKATIPSYSSSNYNFKCTGTVYGGESPYSGIVETVVKYLN